MTHRIPVVGFKAMESLESAIIAAWVINRFEDGKEVFHFFRLIDS